MSKVQRGLVLSVAALIIAVPALAADFYETQLRLGAEAYRTGRLPDAIDYLKIANFGLLDRPPLLLEGLARLALAQTAAGLAGDTRKTVERFVSVERQFPAWPPETAEPELRERFETLLRETLSPEALAGVSSISGSVSREETRVESMTPDQRRKQYESKARSEPRNARWPLLVAREDAKAGETRSALRWADKALDIDPGLVEARVLRVALYTGRREYSRAATELTMVPAASWFDYPEINADAFVIYTKANELDRAAALFDRIPPELASRPDLAEAMAAFRQKESARLEDEAVKEMPDEDVGPVAEVRPEASPVEGSSEPVDARINAPRGSFTSPADPVAEALATSKRLIGESRAAEAQLVLRDALRTSPGVRELRLAMLEASCLAADWRTGISQLLLLEPFRKGEEKYMFYGAVTYFESEKSTEARRLMQAALPRLSRNPYVDHYVRLVLGE